jgi:FkbM family methyltransferase
MNVLVADRFITPCLEVYGEYCPDEWRMLDQIIKPGMTVVEAGANIGAHTVPMARKCAPGTLYAFEPQREVLAVLIDNLRLNAITNVSVRPAGTGDVVGVAFVPPLNYGEAGNFGGVSLQVESGGYPVRVQPIDDLNLTACGLLKIDVEGAELATLRGAAETISRCRPVIYVENDRAASQQALISWLSERGYALHWHAPALVKVDNFNRVTTNVFGSRLISINMLCIPDERATVIQGLEKVDPRDWRSPKGR